MKSKCREFRDEGLPGMETGFVARSPLGVKQHVADDPVDDQGVPAWRVHVRTHALKGFEGTPEQFRALSSEMSRSKLCAVVRNAADPTRLELASSLHVNAANRAWAPRLLVLIARQQLADARHLAGVPALCDAGFLPDVSARNSEWSGPNQLDWIGPETSATADSYELADITADMTQALAVLHNEWQLHAVRTPRGVVATVPCQGRSSGNHSALIEIEAEAAQSAGAGTVRVVECAGLGGYGGRARVRRSGAGGRLPDRPAGRVVRDRRCADPSIRSSRFTSRRKPSRRTWRPPPPGARSGSVVDRMCRGATGSKRTRPHPGGC